MFLIVGRQWCNWVGLGVCPFQEEEEEEEEEEDERRTWWYVHQKYDTWPSISQWRTAGVWISEQELLFTLLHMNTEPELSGYFKTQHKKPQFSLIDSIHEFWDINQAVFTNHNLPQGVPLSEENKIKIT